MSVLFSENAIRFYAAMGIAFLVYRLGLSAYFRQKNYEQFQNRYLRDGIDMMSGQCDYVLGVYRHNWAVFISVLYQYRDLDAATNTDAFFNGLIELDNTKLQMGSYARTKTILNSKAIWISYQKIHAFVTTSTSAIKDDFGAELLRVIAKPPSHAEKTDFIKLAEAMSENLSDEANVLNEIVGYMYALGELLAKSDYTMKESSEFSKRFDVRSQVRKIEECLENLKKKKVEAEKTNEASGAQVLESD